jgi:hypothetical protein
VRILVSVRSVEGIRRGGGGGGGGGRRGVGILLGDVSFIVK